MAKQWHPYFAHLLRQMVEGYYEVRTNVPVGDVPREADIVLLRRTNPDPLPFVGIWRYLTVWNVLEYKGPTVSARLDDLDLLVELGLGIHRRLHSECRKEKQSAVPARNVSFWYLANRLGQRFLSEAAEKLGPFDCLADGIWRAVLLRHPLYIVSSSHLSVEQDTLPIHLLGVDTEEKSREVDRLVNSLPSLREQYQEIWTSLHPEKLKEFIAMARSTKRGPVFHLMPLVEVIGWDETLKQLGTDRIMQKLLADNKNRKKIMAQFIGQLTAAEREELRQAFDRDKSN